MSRWRRLVTSATTRIVTWTGCRRSWAGRALWGSLERGPRGGRPAPRRRPPRVRNAISVCPCELRVRAMRGPIRCTGGEDLKSPIL